MSVLEQDRLLLLHNATDVIAKYDLDGTFTYLSPAIFTLIGRRPEDVVGQRTFSVIHPEDHARVAREFRALLRSGAASARIEYRALRADGTTVWVEAHPAPVFGAGGKVTGFQDVARDISARRAAREAQAAALMAAQASEARFRLLAENANDMVATMSPDSTVLFVTPAVHRMLGYTPEEVVGQKTLSLTHPDDIPGAVALFTALIQAGPGAPIQPYSFRGRHKAGHWIWLEGQPRVEFDAAGVPLRFQDVVRDITARKTLEQQLQAARAAAETAAQVKSDFLANMSHELRTPLTGILGYAELLARTPGLDQESRRRAGMIRDAGGLLLLLVNDVLDMSKIEAGGVALSPRPAEIGRLVEDAADFVRSQAEAKGLLLRVTLPERAWPVLVDPDRLRQVLLNLLTNAVKFTDAGAVELRMGCTDMPEERVEVTIEVSDTGIGIAADRLAHVFDRFEQADSSITRRFGGTGLGLAISQAVVEAMGGKLAASSRLGEGSVFKVGLTLAAADPVWPAGVPSPSPAAYAGACVLVADDVDMNRDVIRLMLEARGLHLTCVASGQAAVAAADAAHFDLVLMDVHMPGMDGLQATRAIRTGGGPNRRTPILALTASVLPAEVARCRAAGMDGHVGKPFTPDGLFGAVAAALANASVMETS